MKNYFEGIFGNENIVSFFSEAKVNGKLCHAYIIEGDVGSGKTTFARMICSMIANANSDLTAKIQSTSCPDITEYGLPEKKKFIPVETVRTIKSQAYIKPSELDIRAFIIKDAHMLTTAGQNALLKLLEEPPMGVYFFLLCQNASMLLPTVRSRAPTIRMQRFSDQQLEVYLNQNPELIKNIEKSQISSICRRANGSIGKLIDLVETHSKAQNDDQIKKIIKCLKDGDFSALLCEVQSLPQDRKQLDNNLADLAISIRDIIASSCGSNLMLANDELIFKELRGNLTIKNLTLIYQCIENARNGINQNMNVQIVKTALAKHMMRAAKQ